MPYVKITYEDGREEHIYTARKRNSAAARERRRKFWQTLKTCEQMQHK